MAVLISEHIETKFMIFKTSLKNEDDLKSIRRHLDEYEQIKRWVVDLEDWERVLKIEVTDNLAPQEIEDTLELLGYVCREMNH
ncbi:MAG: hypothetical protein RLN88_09335 [Ekhidna sp.]|uniref:hypothetical protein n=1 Tax=Ekhidna sp. TaxID=2608089 RepID=UPI0032EB6308